MADIKLNYISNGADQIKKDYEIIKRETKKISESPVKITMKSDGVQEAIDAFGRLRVEIPKLEQSYNSLQNKNSTVAKTMLKDINSLKSAFGDLNNIINKQGRVSGNVFDNFKNSGQLAATLNSQKQITEEIRTQQREIERLEQKAKEAGSLTKSLLQNEGLNTKGSKNTQAQYEYQIEALKKTLSLIRETEGATEKYNHALQSMTYEIKHVTGKELYQDALESIREITKLENKRFEAQKNGKVVMEDYYNTEIQKQKEVLDGIIKTANDPTQLKTKLQANYQMIYDSLNDMPEVQAEFAEQFKQTGNLTQAWSDGMKKFVVEARNGITTQEQLNQKLLEQHNLEQKEKEYISLLQQKFQLENKITQLSKDKQSTKANQNQIAEYKRQIELINQKLQGIQKETTFTEQTKKKVDDLTTAHKNEQAAIKAKNQDLDKSNNLISDSLKNFAKFTLYYQSLILLRQGIQKAIETMRELDAAFTDIRIVTNQSAEETAQLAQEYNA